MMTECTVLDELSL